MNRLLSIGFEKVGTWKLVEGNPVSELVALQNATNVIYAFVSDGDIKYIGKTTMALKRRMYGYQNPGPTQSTNINNNRRITETLLEGQAVDILALADNGLLRYADYHINLAAGLEDGLIAELDPQWNSTRTKKASATSRPEPASVKCSTASPPAPKNCTIQPKSYRGKYRALKKYLSVRSGTKNLVLSFPEIEQIASAKLPKSAYIHRPWWANSGQTQARAWMEAGWLVDHVSLGKSVAFRQCDSKT